MQGGLFGVPEAERPTHRDHFRRRLEWLQALAIPTLVIVPSFTARPSDSDLSRAADNLAEAASTAAPFGVRLALEFQKTAAFCASLDTAIALVEHASQPNLGVCLDLFHYYTGPSKFEDLGYLRPRNLAHVQVCDLSGTPRELASDTDRVLPGDGDFQIAPILDHLRSLGYEAGVSVEVNNPALWQIPADRVAEVALRALERFVQLPTSSDDGGA
jgi:sugar phosphate isomerase/epimerase